MAMIPKKNPSKGLSDDGTSFETIMVLFGSLFIIESQIEPYVSKQFSIILLGVLLIIIAYMILPSRVNHGQSGYMRIMIMIRYKIEKIKERMAQM